MARVMAGVARRLQGAIDTHVTGLTVSDGKVTASRCFYRQRIEAALLRSHRPWVLLMDPGSRAAWSGTAVPATVEKIEVSLAENARRTTVEGTITPPADQQTIRPDAKLLFVAGAGWTKKQKEGQPHIAEAETAILDFLKHTKASLGGSKSLVDLSGEGQAVLGFMTHLNQVGQTGATPRHPKGLSTCCHGEEPHVVGWRFISERRAVNLDPNCGWARGKTDVLYVADAFEVMKKVNALFAEGSNQQSAVASAVANE
jgi:electron transfer flavoprotein alpha subunit